LIHTRTQELPTQNIHTFAWEAKRNITILNYIIKKIKTMKKAECVSGDVTWIWIITCQ